MEVSQGKKRLDFHSKDEINDIVYDNGISIHLLDLLMDILVVKSNTLITVKNNAK